MKRIITLTLTFVMMFSVTAFGVTTVELQKKFDAAEEQINENIAEAQEDVAKKAYPVGSIYTTFENISEDDMHDRVGGTWRELNDTFLWASDKDVGSTGGNDTYEIPSYLNPNPNGVVLDTEEGLAKVPILQRGRTNITIMPPYTVVKMFKRVR